MSLSACKDNVSDSSSNSVLGDGIELVDDTLPIEGEPTEDEGSELFSQDFEGFDSNRNWFLSDFGLNGERDKELYVAGDELKFDIRWTNKARKLLADRLGYERSEMNHQLANSLCEPKIEIGKEHVYTNSNSENLIAELDTDMSHCGVNGQEPAAISIRSFVPTKVGYKYSVKVRYMMRSYGAMTDQSYKDLVVRFGSELEKFDPEFDNFIEANLHMVATRKYSKLTLHDNGLPNSFGVLIDDIIISEHGKVANYDECAELFSLNSKGFRKCVQGEVDTDQVCSFSNPSNTKIKTSKGEGIPANRRDVNNIFNIQAPQNGNYNFFSLGLKGKVQISCAIDGHAALYPIEGKTLALREISWGNANVDSYPELAKVRVKLEDCDNDELNRTINVGTVQTNEMFSITFDQDSEGRSYAGCKMNKLIIKDISPSTPSVDGFDLNSLHFVE